MGVAKKRKPAKKTARSQRRAVGSGGVGGLYQYRDAIDFPAVNARLEGKFPVSVFVEPPGEVRRFARYAPEFLVDPDKVGLFSGFGKDAITYPPAFVAVGRNVRVVGFRTVLSEDGFFFNDDSVTGRSRQWFLRELAEPDPLNEETGLKKADSIDRFRLDPGERRKQHIKGTTVLLASHEPSNYGSWLFRVLPKLHTLSQVALPRQARYLVWAGFESFKEYLSLLGIPEDRIVHLDPTNTIYQLDKVIVPSMRNNQAFLDPQSVAFFADIRTKWGRSIERGKKIYVSRIEHSKNWSSRVMLNEEELVERLLELGFRVVSPEMLSVPEQIAEFSSAEMVVGPSGSGMFNVVFCHPGTKVIDIESEPHWIHAHRSLFASCGLRYGIFVGSAADRSFRVHHQRWKVNIDALIAQVTAFSQA